MAPGSSMLADSCGATQLKEGLSVSSVKGRGLPKLNRTWTRRVAEVLRDFFFFFNDLVKKDVINFFFSQPNKN